MVYNISPSTAVLKILKKTKDKKLKNHYLDGIYVNIATDPYGVGEQKKGGRSNVFVYSFKYQKTSYRIAYTSEEEEIVPILLADKRERFYEQRKRLIHKPK